MNRVVVTALAAITPLGNDVQTSWENLLAGKSGIGKVTKPGLAIPPGEWAINPVPRRMIQQALASVLSESDIQNSAFTVVISIPDGEERAK